MGSETKTSDQDAHGVIRLSARSIWGPFAKGAVTLDRAKAVVKNRNRDALAVASATVSPLISERTGLAADAGSLAAEVVPRTVPAGDSIEVAVTGSAPARPGSYLADLDVKSAGADPISTPLRVDVAASAFWGVLCLLLGLSLLGVAKLLTGAGGIEETTRQALLFKAAVSADWAHNPPPASHAEAIAEINRNIDDALRSLAAPRGYSVVDRRVPDATAALAAAREAHAELRKALSDASPGVLEIDDLAKEWDAFKTRLNALSAAPAFGASAAQTFSERLRAMSEGLQDQLVAAYARAARTTLEPHVERVRLALAAGEGGRARDTALATRSWMQRAADELERRQALAMGYVLLDTAMLVSDARIRRVAADQAIPPEERTKLIESLDTADAKLASGLTLENLRDAHALIEDAVTESLRARAAVILDKVHEAANAAGDEMSVEPMFAELTKLGPPASLSDSDYFKGMGAAFAVWRRAMAHIEDDAARATMDAAAAAGIDAAAHQDKAGVKKAYETLKADWRDYLPKHIAAASARAVAPYCDEIRKGTLQEIAFMGESVKLQSGRPEVAEWESALDRARINLQMQPSGDVDCIGKLNDEYGQAIAVSGAVFRRGLEDAGIPMDARLDAANRSGDAAAVALIQQLSIAPRDISLKVSPLLKEAVAGDRVLFVFDSLDPNWGPGVDVAVDWGDRSAKFRTDAQKLLRNEPVEHIYPFAQTFNVTATASIRGSDVGRSALPVVVAPSPASLAERLADVFLTSQFALALLIASVVYYWRFHSGAVTFGAISLHYVQAFALGFVAYAAVADLPKAFADLILK